MGSNRYGGGLGIQAFDELEKDLAITDERELVQFAEAKLGVELEDFLASPVGRYVIGRARHEIEDFNDWALSDQAMPEQFQQRRANALAARTLISWLSEQVAAGLAAEAQLKNPQQG